MPVSVQQQFINTVINKDKVKRGQSVNPSQSAYVYSQPPSQSVSPTPPVKPSDVPNGVNIPGLVPNVQNGFYTGPIPNNVGINSPAVSDLYNSLPNRVLGQRTTPAIQVARDIAFSYLEIYNPGTWAAAYRGDLPSYLHGQDISNIKQIKEGKSLDVFKNVQIPAYTNVILPMAGAEAFSLAFPALTGVGSAGAAVDVGAQAFIKTGQLISAGASSFAIGTLAGATLALENKNLIPRGSTVEFLTGTGMQMVSMGLGFYGAKSDYSTVQSRLFERNYQSFKTPKSLVSIKTPEPAIDVEYGSFIRGKDIVQPKFKITESKILSDYGSFIRGKDIAQPIPKIGYSKINEMNPLSQKWGGYDNFTKMIKEGYPSGYTTLESGKQIIDFTPGFNKGIDVLIKETPMPSTKTNKLFLRSLFENESGNQSLIPRTELRLNEPSSLYKNYSFFENSGLLSSTFLFSLSSIGLMNRLNVKPEININQITMSPFKFDYRFDISKLNKNYQINNQDIGFEPISINTNIVSTKPMIKQDTTPKSDYELVYQNLTENVMRDNQIYSKPSKYYMGVPFSNFETKKVKQFKPPKELGLGYRYRKWKTPMLENLLNMRW